MTYRKINHAFIMAAGRGTRLMPLTKKIPKGLVKFKQTSLIARGIKRLKKYINFVHISVGYKGPILAKHLIEEKVSSIINTDKKGNSWWIFNSIFKSFNSPIYVLTCDNVTNIDFKKLEKDYYKKGQPLCMLIPTKPIKGLAGDFIFKKGAGKGKKTLKIHPVRFFKNSNLKKTCWDFDDAPRAGALTLSGHNSLYNGPILTNPAPMESSEAQLSNGANFVQNGSF